jgi:Fe-S oxidoreductase
MFPPEIIGLFGEVKHVFDPGNMLNPGIIVDPAPPDTDLRLPLVPAAPGSAALALRHDGGDLGAAVHRCVGVGRCRVRTPDQSVMCPSFQATGDERDSTRGRARVLQEAAAGGLIGGFTAPEVADSLDLCLSCKGCSRDCPTGVDMAAYKAEVLHRRYRRRLRPASHYSLGWLPRWSRFAARAPRLVNGLLTLPGLAGLGKRLAGIDPRRQLPLFARQTLRDWLGRRPPGRPGRPVLLWADTFTDRFSPEVGRAAVRVLEAAGYQVQAITQDAVCCGLTWLSTGQLDGARRQLRRSLTALADAVAAGVPVVVLEPSCAAVFRSDALELLSDDPRAAATAGAVHTLAELLAKTPGWRAPDLSGVRGIAQPHCHQHAVLGWEADARLLADAGAEVSPVGGCCGLAGNWGAEKGHYDLSAAVAGTSLLPALRELAPGGAVLADGFSCRTQISELGGGARARHLAEVLAERLP